MYDDVKTFVIFLGYSTPMESLTSAMLNAHPEILIPQQYDIIGNWKMFRDNNLQDLGQQKYLLFFHLHYLSRYQSLFRNKANKPSQFWLWTYKGDIVPNFFVPDSRQESIKGKIKVGIFKLVTLRKAINPILSVRGSKVYFLGEDNMLGIRASKFIYFTHFFFFLIFRFSWDLTSITFT